MCASCDYEDFLDELTDLSIDERFGFALDTIEGIYETVSKMSHCTPKQKTAIANIRRSVEDR